MCWQQFGTFIQDKFVSLWKIHQETKHPHHSLCASCRMHFILFMWAIVKCIQEQLYTHSTGNEAANCDAPFVVVVFVVLAYDLSHPRTDNLYEKFNLHIINGTLTMHNLRSHYEASEAVRCTVWLTARHGVKCFKFQAHTHTGTSSHHYYFILLLFSLCRFHIFFLTR